MIIEKFIRGFDTVFIPNPREKRLINSLKKNRASIPVIFSKDSIKYKVKNQLFNLNRK